MKNELITAGSILFSATALGLLLTPLLQKFALRCALVDKPNPRKLHQQPVAVAGGLSILLVASIVLLPTGTLTYILQQWPALPAGCALLFAIGLLDDARQVRPVWRLLLQLLCAAAVAASGIRIESLYGLFGIGNINTGGQYLLTILVITGVTNAFNLTDGVNGLAGGLAIIVLLLFAVLAAILQQAALSLLLIALCGATIAFLRYNLIRATIFMGDNGALVLGFLLSATGILLIGIAQKSNAVEPGCVAMLVASSLLLPVFDSLRVYGQRMARGVSPFRPDNTHLHHLLLLLQDTHLRTSLTIYVMETVLIAAAASVYSAYGFSLSIIIPCLLLLCCTFVLQLNASVVRWTQKIRAMEGFSR
jgi:UDP-GlcNAc:undecaprenyl-phosphate GlcNAc-1-phosphate transferase